MAEFHETRMGMRFYEADVPRMVKALEGLQKAVEQLTKAAQPVAPAPAPEKKCGESICCDDPDCAEMENRREARLLARAFYESDEIEIPDDAEVDLAFSGPENDLQVTGAWVAARVWVEFTANSDRCPGCGGPVEHKGKPIFDPLTGKTHTKTECVRCDVLGNKGDE